MNGTIRQPTGKRRGRIGWLKHFQDFSSIHFISAGAALVLAAEYDRISRVAGIAPATVNVDTWRPVVRRILSQLGFFRLLDLPDTDVRSTSGIIIESMVAENRAKMSGGIAAIKSLFAKIDGDDQLRIQLGSAVTDAVENVVGHAYPVDMPDRRRHVPLWWFVGAAEPGMRRLTLVIYDQGITIPASLPRKWPLNRLASLFVKLFGLPFRPNDPKFDGEAIHTAMNLGATSSGLHHRGRGLTKIRDIISGCQQGQLRIVSRFGECIYRADGSQEIRSHDVELMGTYVELQASFGREERQDV